MKRFALSLAAAACLSVLPATTAAGAGCPNEAFRAGPASLLPACRAYELVSPPEKHGGSIAPLLGFHVSPDGSAVRFSSSASFVEAPASPLANPYLALRGSEWTTESIDVPQQNVGGVLVHTSPAGAQDDNRTLVTSKVALTPGAIEGGSNVYIRENPSGDLLLVTGRPGNRIFNQLAGVTSSGYVEGTADWSHVLFQLPEELVPGAPVKPRNKSEESPQNLYEYVPGSSDPLRLVNILPNGKPTRYGATIGGESTAYSHRISSDGSRIYFQDETGEGPIYMREDDSVTYPVSVTPAGKPAAAIFGGASANGSFAYLIGREPLTTGAQGTSLYRWTAPSGPGGKGTLTNLTAGGGEFGPEVERVLAVSEDGSYVYFTAAGVLAKGATPGESAESTNVYVWHEGTIRLVAHTENGNGEYGAPSQFAASPDGDTFSLGSYSLLTPDALPGPNCPHSDVFGNGEERCRQVYVYEYAAASLRCVSCNGLPPLADSSIGGEDHRENGSGDETARPLLADGTVFMTTPDALVARDSNGIDDAYAWTPSRGPELISTGTSVVPSSFGDATPDGSNVFFLTAQRLVGTDTDNDVDVYDDRELGGIASQFPSTPPGSCEGEGCRGASPSAPPTLAPGSVVAGRDCADLATEAGRTGSRAKGLARRAKAVHGKGAATARKKRRLRREAAAASRRARQLREDAKSCGR